MAWLVLAGAGSLEAVWAVALGKAEGFTKLVPTLVFLVAIGVSMAGLAYALLAELDLRLYLGLADLPEPELTGQQILPHTLAHHDPLDSCSL